MDPTEHELTVAVDAAARSAYTAELPAQYVALQPFDELHPLMQNQWREKVLGPIIDALRALPDRRATALADAEAALANRRKALSDMGVDMRAAEAGVCGTIVADLRSRS